MSGTLYIAATPIGNLEDITLRALRILKEVDFIVTEDSRVTGILLKHYDIQSNILTYHQHSSDSRKNEIFLKLMDDKNLALVTDAGTPGISDPGNELIAFLLEREPQIPIVPIPGASALTTALSASGLNVSKFLFIGFLPKKKRKKLFSWIKEGEIPFAFYESPHRIVKSLELVEITFGPETEVFVARELTKMYETLYRGSVATVKKNLLEGKVRGELVVVVDL